MVLPEWPSFDGHTHARPGRAKALSFVPLALFCASYLLRLKTILKVGASNPDEP